MENNLFHPNCGETEGEEPDKNVSNESYRYFLSLVVIAEYRGMCEIHSIGHKAGFVDFVNNFSSTILKSVAEYKQTFTFDRLIQGAVAKRYPCADEIYMVHGDIAMIESALTKKKLLTWGDLDFENPLSCTGNILK